MVNPDDDITKWDMTKHTEFKHTILSKYFKPWLWILGKSNKRILCFDCFAGRGEYTDGSFGSPIKILDIATKSDKYFNELICTFIEKDKNNFEHLDRIIKEKAARGEISKKIKYLLINDEFENVATTIITKYKTNLAPSFFFIDPFGFSGVSFKYIAELMKIEKSEILFNFICRDVHRFVTSPQHQGVLKSLFGNEEYKKAKTPEDLVNLYEENLKKTGVKYIISCKICEDKTNRPLFYLIFATNSFKGFELMKETMNNASTNKGIFGFLGKVNQQRSLAPFMGDSSTELAEELIKKFSKDKHTFLEIRKMTSEENRYIEKDYRAAIKKLEKENRVQVERKVSKRTGIKDGDVIIFEPKVEK